MSIRNPSLPIYSWLDRLDQTLVRFMTVYGIHLLRWAVAIVYLWFGGLKLINASPAAELVVQTVFWLPPRSALLFIGGWEVLIGIGLLFTHPLVLRTTLLLLWLQALGTFQVFLLLVAYIAWTSYAQTGTVAGALAGCDLEAECIGFEPVGRRRRTAGGKRRLEVRAIQ
jgi:hypothetical protein